MCALHAAAKGERVYHVCPTARHASDAFQVVRDWVADGLLSDSVLINLNERRIAFPKTKGSVTFTDHATAYLGLSCRVVDASHEEAGE
jgi:hypothetical protein